MRSFPLLCNKGRAGPLITINYSCISDYFKSSLRNVFVSTLSKKVNAGFGHLFLSVK